jgi:hypothetical protein
MKMKFKKGFALFYFLMLVFGFLTIFCGTVMAASPSAPATPLPEDGGYWDYFLQNETLSCIVVDPDGDTTNVTFFVGDTAIGTNTAVANNTRTYMDMGFTPSNYTTYYWHVTVNDSTTNVTGPTWVFKGAGKDKDIVQDGVVDQLDLDNFSENYLWSGTSGTIRADITNNGVVNYLDGSALTAGVGDIYKYSLYPPTSIALTGVNTTAVNLSWTTGTGTTVDKTIIKYSETNYSATPDTDFYSWKFENGTEIYNGTGNYYVHSGLSQGTKYYYAFWSYNETEASHYLMYSSDEIYDITFGIEDPELPTSVAVDPGMNQINLSWTAGVGTTDQDRCVIYYDTVNHTSWTTANGTLIANVTGEYYLHSALDYDETYYYALFSYNSTYSLLSTDCALINSTTLDYPVDNVATFTAAATNSSSIAFTFTLPTGADAIYIEYYIDTAPAGWDVGDGDLFYNGSTSPQHHNDLNANRGYWYKAWGWNETYGLYSLIGALRFARTESSSVTKILIGDNYHDIVKTDKTDRTEWADHIYPNNWYSSLTSKLTTWFNAQPSKYRTTPFTYSYWLTDLMKFYDPYIEAPYSWWHKYLETSLFGEPEYAYLDEYPNKVASYATHIISDMQAASVEFTYATDISGGITGIGFYFIGDTDVQEGQVAFNRPFRGDDDYNAISGFPVDYSKSPSRPGLEISDVTISPTRDYIHLQINDQPMPAGVFVQDGYDEYYNQNCFFYWDILSTPVIIDNEPIRIEILFDAVGKEEYYFLFTTAEDIDDDGSTGMYFSVGNDAINNYNSESVDGIFDTNRDVNYFFTYNPNLHYSAESGGESLTDSDQLIITPDSVGLYETTNIIYFLTSTEYMTNFTVFAPSNATSAVYTKYLELDRGNVFFTPTEAGIYTVKLTRNAVETCIESFQVLDQSPHGYVYATDNPAIVNQLNTFHVYYDIPDYAAVMRLEKLDGTVVTQWTVPNNRTTNLYSFSYQVSTSGKYFLKLYQQRTYDEQMITSYVFYVKDREYATTIEPSTLNPYLKAPMTFTVTSNIVGVSGMNLNFYAVAAGSRKMYSIPVGDTYISEVDFTPTRYTGQWDVKFEMFIVNVGTFQLSNVSMIANEQTVAPPVEEDDIVVNVPDLISLVGPALGISDPMFRIIIGVVIVLLIMFLPLVVAWKLNFKYADMILTNPMVYSVTAIIGSLISFALGLFDLWIFVLIFIVALTFLIRAWRGQGSPSAE